MKKDKTEVIALLVRGFWSNNQFGRVVGQNNICRKWIIFTDRMPIANDYVTYDNVAGMLSPEGKAQLANYRSAEIQYKRRVLQGLEIMDTLNADDDIALWEVNTDTIPGALQTIEDEYYSQSLANYNLNKGAFVQAMADGYGEKRGLCFAIKELLETRAAIIDEDDNYTLVVKKPGENIKNKTGQIGE